MELDGEHSTLYDCKDTCYARKDKIDLVLENSGKELNESGKFHSIFVFTIQTFNKSTNKIY
jgi:hypothetical protein